MKLILNGEQKIWREKGTLAELLNDLKIHSQRVASEVNGNIIRRKDYDHCQLNDRDTVEIVQMIGGG